MKRLFAFLVVLILLTTFISSCNSNNDNSGSSSQISNIISSFISDISDITSSINSKSSESSESEGEISMESNYTSLETVNSSVSTAVSSAVSKAVSKIETVSTVSKVNSKPESRLEESKPPVTPKQIKVAYIPIDDRPVNVDRVIYQAQSGGIELIMPDKDLFSTKLDGCGTNKNGTTLGDRQALLNWLKSVDEDCEYFVLSMDQLLSGGLVGSRSMKNEELSFEYSVIDYLTTLAKSNRLYLFDTVIRLASTVGYNGYTIAEYSELRKYGNVARQTLSGSSLTVENIIAGYGKDSSGKTVSTSLSNTVIGDYLKSRARKLHLADYMLQKLGSSINVYIFIVIDDSSQNTTIQTNEINYIKSKINRGTIFAGTDELGMMGFARYSIEASTRPLTVKVRYFGGQEHMPADSFDVDTLEGNINSHLDSLNVNIVTSGKADLEVLVLTKPRINIEHSLNALNLVNAALENQKGGIPTAVIDASGKLGDLQRELVSKVDLSMLVGYSSWNTVGNAMGIALGQSVVRVNYLLSGMVLTDEANEGFLKSMTFAYIKDIAYIIDKGRSFDFGGVAYYRANESVVNGRLKSEMLGANGTLSATSLLENINGGAYLASIDPFRKQRFGKITLDNFRLPWYRSFEMNFDISIS